MIYLYMSRSAIVYTGHRFSIVCVWFLRVLSDCRMQCSLAAAGCFSLWAGKSASHLNPV